MVYIRELTPDDATEVTSLYLKNRDNLKMFEPIREEDFYTLKFQQNILRESIYADTLYIFGIFTDSHRFIGRLTLSRITRGAFQNAGIGYWMDVDNRNKGFMTEAVKQAVSYAFYELGLHRVEASVMINNLPSQKVLEKSGFERIGLARKYLCINGSWEDHYLYQIIKE